VTGFDPITVLDAAFADAEAAPLSAKKAMLVALLVDAAIDRNFAASARASADVLTFREETAARSPALAEIMALAAMRADGPRLVTDAVKVPIADYGNLSTPDFMVSLYNGHTVQRVLIARPDGTRAEIHPLLRDAIAALRGVWGGDPRPSTSSG
jgi:hypothetical protein